MSLYNPSPDELYHFKYVKRYKGRTGKWQYVYADKATHNKIQSGVGRSNQVARSRERSKQGNALFNLIPGDKTPSIARTKERAASRQRSIANRRNEEARDLIYDNEVRRVAKNAVNSAKSKAKSTASNLKRSAWLTKLKAQAKLNAWKVSRDKNRKYRVEKSRNNSKMRVTGDDRDRSVHSVANIKRNAAFSQAYRRRARQDGRHQSGYSAARRGRI